jgi:pimeloyl-ACP methyl ester carboxylesterase
MKVKKILLACGIRLSYREAGVENRTAIVQVHGLGTGHHNFDGLTPHLASDLHVFDVDLPGYGESDEAEHDRSIGDFAGDVAEFIEGLALGRAHLHGTSMGGAIAVALASRRPDLVDRMVVSCSFGRFDRAAHAMFDTWRIAADCGGIEALVTVTSHQGFSRGFWERPDALQIRGMFAAALEGTTPERFLRDLASIEAADLQEHAMRVRAPTLLLAAAEDIMTPVTAAASGLGMDGLHSLIESSTLRVLPDCGHFISIERPEETARAISEFVRGAEVS